MKFPLNSIVEAMLESRHYVPRGEIWMVGADGVRRIYNIGIGQKVQKPEPELKIGDWPWPEPKKGKQ